MKRSLVQENISVKIMKKDYTFFNSMLCFALLKTKSSIKIFHYFFVFTTSVYSDILSDTFL